MLPFSMIHRLRRSWSDLPLALKGFGVVGLPMLVFALSGLLTLLSINHTRQAEHQVNQAYAAQLELQRVQNLVLSASTDVRGYLLTGREDLTKQFSDAHQSLPESLAKLERYLAKDPEQLEAFHTTQTQIEQTFAALAALLELAPNLQADSTTLNGVIVTGQVVMESLQTQFDVLQLEQVRLVRRLEAAETRALGLYYPAIFMTLILGLVGALAGMALFASSITRRVRALSLSAERLAKGKSVLARENSRDEIGHLNSVLSLTGQLLRLRENELKQATITISHKFDELTEQHQHIVVLNQLADALQRCQRVEDTYSVIGDKVMALCPNSSGALYIFSETRVRYELKECWGEPDSRFAQTFLPGECQAYQHGLYYTRDAERSSYCGHASAQYPYTSLCCTLSSLDRQVGLLQLSGNAAISENVQQILRVLADRAALAMVNLELHASLLEQAIRDPLTGLYNRRYLDETLARELKRSGRASQPLSAIVFDIDHFKKLNDRYGHAGGDEVLKALGRLLGSGFRAQDIACRYGGEEFVIILPETGLEPAAVRAEDLAKQVRDLRIVLSQGQQVKLSISVGVASYPQHGDNAKSLLSSADSAMYRAKHAGRDRVARASVSLS